jgi:MFS family permease
LKKYLSHLTAVIKPTYEGNITRIFIFLGLYNFMFFMPIWVIFLKDKHELSLVQIAWIDLAFWLTMAITEIPTGAVADTVGRKRSQQIGTGLVITSVLLFSLTNSYSLLILANSLWAFAITFISGADMALLFDTLRFLGREHEYITFRGTAMAVSFASTALGSIIGGLLTLWHIASPFVLYALLLGVGFLVLIPMVEPPPEPDPDTGQRIGYLKTLTILKGALVERPNLRFALAYSNLLPLMGAAVLITFIQPHAIAIGVPTAALGILVFGLNLVRSIGSAQANRVVAWFGTARWLWLAPLLVAVGLIGLGAVPSLLGVLIFTLAAAAAVISRPVLENLILAYAPGSIRATILSVDNLIFRLLLAFLEPAVALFAERVSLPSTFILMGVLIGVILILTLAAWRRFSADSPLLLPTDGPSTA